MDLRQPDLSYSHFIQLLVTVSICETKAQCEIHFQQHFKNPLTYLLICSCHYNNDDQLTRKVSLPVKHVLPELTSAAQATMQC